MDGWGKWALVIYGTTKSYFYQGTDVFVKLRCLDEAGDAEI